jgi:methylated-DNA-[protein]-cysteine S-methyltransferase
MLRIPYGRTSSYADMARALDSGPRAIGGACARNPIPIIIPCHRVLASGARIGGYSSPGGTDTKRFLLQLEGVRCAA